MKVTHLKILLLVLCAIFAVPVLTSAQNQTLIPPTTDTLQPVAPAVDLVAQQQQQPRPTTPATPRTELPPNSSSAPVRPANEAQQSQQPQSGLQQERQQTQPGTQEPRPVTPQIQPTAPQTAPVGDSQNPSGANQTPASTTLPNPNTANPAGVQTGNQTGVVQQGTPDQTVGTSSGVAPAKLPDDPPPIAPNFEAPARPLPSAERVGVDLTDQMPLTLDEAIRLALANNNDIDGSRINVQIAEFELNAARGVYDPVISSESYYESRVTPTSSTLGGAQNGSVAQNDFTGAARVGGFSPVAGGSYQIDFSSTRLTTNNQNATLNPQFPSALTLTYTQPLWRGLRFDNNRRTIEIAKKNLSLTDAQFRQRAIEVIAQVEGAYWDLVFALRNLQVQIDAVKQARIQVESNQRLVARGVLAPIDIVAANTQVTTFEQSVYTAQEAVTRAENTLKTLMLPERTDAMWSRPLTPVTPITLEAPRVPLEQAVAAALANRPEIAQLQTNTEINQLDTRFFRDQTKPQIDLIGSYTSVGLAGTRVTNPQSTTTNNTSVLLQRVNELSARAGLDPVTQTVIERNVNPNLIGGYGQSLGNLFGLDYPTYRVGVAVSLPFRNRTAEANLGRSLAVGTSIQNQLAQTEQLIEADVRNATQTLRSAEARLASAAAARSSAEQQYESEQRQFRAGTTTVFLVLQRQNELLAARGRELQAQTDLNKSIADFQRATGNTLNNNNVFVRTDTQARRELEMRSSTTTNTNTRANGVTTPTATPTSSTGGNATNGLNPK